jgi:hypothetical protein
VYPHALSYAQIQHDLFATSRNGICSHVAVESLDLATLASSTVAQAAEDLRGFSSTEFECRGSLRFKASDGTTQLEHSFHLAHLLALVDTILQPVVGRFDLASHMCKLQANNRMFYQFLAERFPLVGVFHGLFEAHARETEALDDDADPFVIEVRHNDYFEVSGCCW